jgi:hypothetical protein
MYCQECDVELEKQRRICPLCKAALLDAVSLDDSFIPNWPSRAEVITISTQHKLFLIWLPLTIISLIAFFIILITDIQAGNGITWSKYPLISLIAGTAYISSIFLFSRHFFIMYTWYGFISLSVITALDKILKVPDWVFSLCIPIIALIYLYGIINFFILLGVKRRMLLFVSFNGIFSSIYFAALDYLIAAHQEDSIFTWSPILACFFVSFALMGFYYYIFLKKQVDLAKFFHF